MPKPSIARESFWGWPGWRHLGFATIVSGLGLIWFVVIYGGCDAITAHRTARIRIHLDSELRIPCIPDFAVLYMSIYLLFAAAPFVLRERRGFLHLALMLNAIILAAGICFLLIPAQLAFSPPTELGHFPALFRLADRLNLTYNLVPSLHVALSVGCLAVFAKRCAGPGKVFLWTWALAISASTLLTHQHHVLDVITGWILALVAVAFAKTKPLQSALESGCHKNVAQRWGESVPASRSNPESLDILGPSSHVARRDGLAPP